MSIYPAILIGLGDVGEEVVSYITTEVIKEDAHLAVVMHKIGITAAACEGWAGTDLIERADDAKSVEENGDAVTQKKLLSEREDREGTQADPWNILDADIRLGVWSHNYASATEQQDHIRRLLRKAVHDVRSFEQVGGYLDTQLDVGSYIDIYVLSSLADPVGSALLPLIVQLLTKELQVVYAKLSYRVHLVLIAPDLVDEEPQPLEQARTYACMQELEALLEGGRWQQAPVQVNNIWLLSGRNERDFFVGTYHNLFPALKHLVHAIMKGEVMSDQSFGVALQQRVSGKVRRYSAFGYASLRFPREQIMELLVDNSAVYVLDNLPALEAKQVEAGSIYAQTRSFIQDEKMMQLEALLRVDSEGHEIWQPFAPPARMLNAKTPDDFLDSISQYAHEYDHRQATQMQRMISERRVELVRRQREAILKQVHSYIDTPEAGSLNTAQAWLAALEGKPSEYIHGDTESFPETLQKIEERIKVHFDRTFSPILFEDEADPEVAAYLEEHDEAHGGRRDRLRRLDYDLATKQRNLEQRKRKVARLQEDLKRLESSDEGKEQAVVGEAGDESFEALSSSATDVFDSTPDVAKEVEPVGFEADGPVSPNTDTVADETERNSSAASARAYDIEQLKQNIEKLKQEIGAYEIDIEKLSRLHKQTGDEIALLDRTITDAAERRRLYEPILDNIREEIGKQEKQYRSTGRDLSSRRRTLEHVRASSMGWIIRAIVAPLIVCIGIIGGLWWLAYEAEIATSGSVLEGVVAWLTDDLWAVASVLVLLALLGGAWVLWKKIGAPMQALQREIRSLEEALKMQGQVLIASHVRLAKKKFDNQVYGSLVDWGEDLGRLVSELRDDLKSFRHDLSHLAQRIKDRVGTHLPPRQLFVDYVFPLENVGGLVKERSERLKEEVDEYWRLTPLSHVFERYRQIATQNQTTSLSHFIQMLRVHLGQVFEDVRQMSLVQYLEEAEPSRQASQARVQRLFQSAAPFAAKSAEVVVNAQSGTQVYVGLDNPDQIGGVIKDSLQALNISPVYYDNKLDTEVSFLRLTIAFAAFQFAPAMIGRYQYRQMPPEQQAELHANLDWLEQLQDIVPSAYRLGDADDALRRVACLAIVYGIANWTEDNTTSEAGISFQDTKFSSYGAWIEYLGSFDGAAARTKVMRLVDQESQGDSAMVLRCLEDAMEWMEKSQESSLPKHRRGFDGIDLQIVMNEIQRYAEV